MIHDPGFVDDCQLIVYWVAIQNTAKIIVISIISNWNWNFALPGGRAFANPRAIPELLTRTRFPIRI